MTKYFNAKVQVIQTRTVHVHVAADSEVTAAELARAQARLKEPGFSVQDICLSLVGEIDLGVGSRVVHSLFGAGVIENLYFDGSSNEFRMQIKFDRGGTKYIHGPGAVIRPEGLVDPEPLMVKCDPDCI
ncbi:hypothetical protein [Comamonas testosteroni]|uniref:hypothetical protein n=1 Tax=Comamonas testosteroni TaxID=285 RepID=UPI00391C0A20